MATEAGNVPRNELEQRFEVASLQNKLLQEELDRRFTETLHGRDQAVNAVRDKLTDLKSLVTEKFSASNDALNSLKSLLDERYATQTKALDSAFVAQQTAMKTAFDAADKAVQAALSAAEKASSKAEEASDKRFEAVNEFRGQLADQAATLLSRVEFTAQHNSLTDKIDILNIRMNDLDKRLTSRLDLGQGVAQGTKDVIGTGYEAAKLAQDQVIANEAIKRARGSQVIALISAFIAIASVITAIIIALHGLGESASGRAVYCPGSQHRVQRRLHGLHVAGEP